MIVDSFFLLTLGFLLTILGGMLIRRRAALVTVAPDPQRRKRFPPDLAETLSLSTMNAAAIALVFVPDLLSELALCLWLLIAALMYWYAAWAKPQQATATQRATR